MNLHDDGRGSVLHVSSQVLCERDLHLRRSPWHHYISAVIEIWMFIAGWAAVCAAVYAITHA